MTHITEELKTAIINLSLDPNYHIDKNPSFCRMYDELMIDFEIAYEESILKTNNLKVIPVATMQLILDFNSYIDSISGDKYYNVWSQEGFLLSPEWGKIRNFAKNIMKDNGWQ